MSLSSPLRILAVCAAVSVLSAASTATAQSTHTEELAQTRFKAGLRYYDRGEYERAREEFLQAQAIFPRPALLRNLALTELHTARPLDALQHLRAYLADVGTTPDKRALAEQSLSEAYALTGHLSIAAPPGTRVKVDGKEIGVAPLKDAVDVAVGLHGVDAEMAGAALHEAVQAGPGKLTEVAFVPPVVAETKVVVATPAAEPATATVSAAPVATVPMREAYWNGRRTAGVVIAGVGVVGMAVGGAFGRRVPETRATRQRRQRRSVRGIPGATARGHSRARPCRTHSTPTERTPRSRPRSSSGAVSCSRLAL